MALEALVSIISSLFGIVGTVSSFHFQKKSKNVEKRLNRFTWHDIESGVNVLNKKISSNFEPEIVLCASTCILRSLADSDAFQSGRCAEHNGRPETLAIIN